MKPLNLNCPLVVGWCIGPGPSSFIIADSTWIQGKNCEHCLKFVTKDNFRMYIDDGWMDGWMAVSGCTFIWHIWIYVHSRFKRPSFKRPEIEINISCRGRQSFPTKQAINTKEVFSSLLRSRSMGLGACVASRLFCVPTKARCLHSRLWDLVNDLMQR